MSWMQIASHWQRQRCVGSPRLVGLKDTIRAFCTRLAESGFVAFAPGLYHGKVADNIADAETLSNALDANQAAASLAWDRTLAYLKRSSTL
jgi:carboxymethylenebutenolidase